MEWSREFLISLVWFLVGSSATLVVLKVKFGIFPKGTENKIAKAIEASFREGANGAFSECSLKIRSIRTVILWHDSNAKSNLYSIRKVFR